MVTKNITELREQLERLESGYAWGQNMRARRTIGDPRRTELDLEQEARQELIAEIKQKLCRYDNRPDITLEMLDRRIDTLRQSLVRLERAAQRNPGDDYFPEHMSLSTKLDTYQAYRMLGNRYRTLKAREAVALRSDEDASAIRVQLSDTAKVLVCARYEVRNLEAGRSQSMGA